MIRLSHISKTYHRGRDVIKAVDDVSLEIRDGEIYGVIGFSGAGKSTLVRCINLLERPDKGGKVEIDGEDVTLWPDRRLRELRSGIGMIFQHFSLMPSRTALENVLYPLRWRGIPKARQLERARELLKLVELSDRENNYPRELSGGQKQRVAIARALANEPKVLLCDEATSALDPTTTGEILQLLKKLNSDLGITIVVITHQLNVVKDICSRVAVMEHGRLVEEGDVFRVFSNPRNEVTRRFISAATPLSKAEQMASLPGVLHLQPGEKFVRLTYTGPGVSEPLISSASNRFMITMNILFADVDLVEGAPIGGTVGIISGEPAKIDEALDYMRQKNVKVEVLANG